MNLNVRAAEEMEKNPCVFREERYDVELDTYKHTCLLTRLPFREPQHTTPCKPEKCPIWKAYIIQLMHTKR